ncbi:AAA family ATPase [bacterium]|nr:AAA family ATPase [bacterium]
MQKISALVLTDEFSTSEVIKLYLSEFDNIEVLPDMNDFGKIIDTFNETHNQSVFIIDISQREKEKIELMHNIASQCKNCRILALSDNPTIELIIDIMRAGAREFIPVPIIKNEFLEAVKKIIEQIEEPKHTNKCKIISIFSNKGGMGKTSLASNLALELANISKEKVALIDMNFQMGDITTFLDLKPSFNISYMLENIDKINEIFLLSTLERYKNTNLYILADPPYFKQADNIQPKQISKLFNILKDTFSYIIVDAESSFDGKNIAALDQSDMIMLVTSANLPALRNTQRCLELFGKLGYDKEKTQIVVNRYMENDEIKEADIEKVLSRKIYWKVPNNYFAIMSAINKGVPVSTANSNSNLAQNYRDLAQYICDNLYKQNIIDKFENILQQS